MTWELASFLILGAALLGGFAWYERSRPTSQVVALVAALAALAVAGRVAFAALPNVVATTDIVVFSGFALGPGPGFAVGALAGLVSNFWLGQGPWTPWQMAGWGMCGVLGAALALVRPRAGRLTLAAFCALAGIAYGALLNFSLMATYGGELSWQRFLALESRAVPFDAAHAIGNATLALIAGPAMVRALTRFRERFQWRAPAVASLLLLGLALITALPAPAQANDVDRAASWLVAAQNADGGWGASPGDDSAADITAWTMLGLEAAGRNPLDLVSRRGRNPVGYLRSQVGELNSPGDLARTILALQGAGVNPRAFGGRDLVGALAKRRRDDGSFAGWPGSTAFAIIALRKAGASGLDASISWLIGAQNENGGWGDLPNSTSTADGTGAALQAIAQTRAAERGLSYLRKAQRPNGGYPTGGSGAVNSQSTAWAVQGMLALGANAGKALDYLAARQDDDGHYRYSASSDQTPVWVTGQVLTAVAGKFFPVPAPPRRSTAEPGTDGSDPESTGPAPPASDAAPPLTLPESFRGGGSGLPAPPPAGGVPVPPSATPGPSPGLPLPGGGLEGDDPEPQPAAPPFEAGENPGPEPWAPVGVGLGTGGLALGGVLFFGRRFGW
ncbi:MAG: prenyltransferase/squalene oxidase repeat-containing protein [Solirubrobacterales bacterium]